MRWKVATLAVLLACGSSKPKPDPRIAVLEQELTQTKDALAKERAAGDALRKSESELKAKADEAQALQDKLAEVVGKFGEVTTADGAVRLELVDRILFPTGEADLTPNGRELLAKVGAALRELDKQIWVQGHTDDQPIFIRKPKPEPVARPAKLVRGQKAKKGKAVKP